MKKQSPKTVADATSVDSRQHATTTNNVEVDTFRLEVPEVTWYKDRGLCKLYLMLPILFIAATIKGYDASLLNGLQTMEPWRECLLPCPLCQPKHHADNNQDFDHPTGATLGLFTAILNIGSFCALPIGALG
jgi:hypothetical protein